MRLYLLRNRVPPFDLSTLPKCGAKTRKGTPCKRCGTKRNGRCKLHGGRSTGPRTNAGRARLAAARTKHGLATRKRRAQIAASKALAKAAEIKAGVHAPKRKPGEKRHARATLEKRVTSAVMPKRRRKAAPRKRAD